LTPCVNVSLTSEDRIRRRYVEIDCKQYIQKEYSAELWINIWCNTEDERETLHQQIDNRINQTLANHYTTCSHYNNEVCSKTNERCEALTPQSNRANKNQCPNLENYQSFFNKNHIPKRTFKTLSVTDLDELELSQSVLRTIFKLEMNYRTYYEIGGRSFTDLNYEKE
ncbi:MAG: hypothetical protein J6M91_07860, partial [Methanobrevibacter sp.]|nr:hypothetical protein [Methanobrevibacter sp.]